MTEFEIMFALVMILCWIVTVVTTRAEIKAIKEDLIFIRSMVKKDSSEFHIELNSHTRLIDTIINDRDNRCKEINDLKDRIDKLEDALNELGKLDIPAQFAKLSDRIETCEIVIDKASDEADGDVEIDFTPIDPEEEAIII